MFYYYYYYYYYYYFNEHVELLFSHQSYDKFVSFPWLNCKQL